jgi:molybdate transport system substrate-binding protein
MPDSAGTRAPLRVAAKRRRPARVNAAWLLFLGSVVALAVLVGMLVKGSKPNSQPQQGASTGPLFVYCAAGIRPPVEAVAKEYEKLFGVSVQLQPGPSEHLLNSAKMTHKGDLFLPADESYVDAARKDDLVAESIPLANMTVVLAVPKGNPKHVASIDDLLKPDVKLGQANTSAAVGMTTKAALTKSGQWPAVEKKTLVFKTTVNDVANDIKLGSVDAGFIWDAMLKQYPALEAVDVPQLKDAGARVTIAVLKSSQQPTRALHFARYLASRDKGLKHFADFGYRVVEGDAWSELPEVRLFAGAMLRPAIERTIQQFEVREGCRVTRVYNGCGILTGEMRSGIAPIPDAYFSCDSTFMTQVTDLFVDSQTISTNQLVILVPKGNPRGIKALKDLAQPKLRLGIGHEKQCAMGALTATTLDQTGLRAAVQKNVVVYSATGDTLVNQLRTGSLDCAIAYISNAVNAVELEAIAIDLPCAIATQPMAIGRESKQKQLTARLMAALASEESAKLFAANGFGWKAKGR